MLSRSIALFRSAIDCLTGIEAAEQRAWTLNHLGTALRHLGERESSSKSLHEAIKCFDAAALIFIKKKFPGEWALTQNNKGNALRAIGSRVSDPKFLLEAIAVHEAALTEVQRAIQPLEWCLVQNNLGLCLLTLGERATDVKILRRSLLAFENAHSSIREMAPAYQISIRNNLGLVNTELGRAMGEPKYLIEAVKVFNGMLEDKELSLTRFDKGNIFHHLGSAQFELGYTTKDVQLLKNAMVSFQEALQLRPKESVPFAWAGTMDNIGAVIIAIAEITDDFADINEAVAVCEEALFVFEKSGATHDAETARSRLNRARELKARHAKG